MSVDERSLRKVAALISCTIGAVVSFTLIAYLPHYAVHLFGVGGILLIILLLLIVPAAPRCDPSVKLVHTPVLSRTTSDSTIASSGSGPPVCRVCLSAVCQDTEEYSWSSDGTAAHVECLNSGSFV